MPKTAGELLFISIGYLGLLLRAIYDLKPIVCCFFMHRLQTEIPLLSLYLQGYFPFCHAEEEIVRENDVVIKVSMQDVNSIFIL
jgi:hypothetical protein